MPITLTWHDIWIRMAWTVVAGFLIGLNRGEQGRAAGLRTTLLVCLAASVAMLLANTLMSTNGKPRDSFVQLDMMRLPLGILSGIGFIGAGAIVRKGSTVNGVTTAATIWFVTVMGLCFGGGAIGLGAAALALGMATLWGMKLLEHHMPQDHSAQVLVATTNDGPDEMEVRAAVESAGYRVAQMQVAFDNESRRRQVRCFVRWRAKPQHREPPNLLKGLARRSGVLRLRWKV